MYKSVPYDDGDKARILEEKEKFDKGKKKKINIYTIDKKEAYKLLWMEPAEKLKPAELLKEGKQKSTITQQ